MAHGGTRGLVHVEAPFTAADASAVGRAGRNGTSTVAIHGAPTGGSFHLSVDAGGGPTDAGVLNYNCTAADVQTAIVSAAGAGPVVAGTNPNFVVTVPVVFGVDLSVGVFSTALTGGTSPGVTVTNPSPLIPQVVAGAAVYEPTVGDIIYDAWVDIDVPFDGTTPSGDFVLGGTRLLASVGGSAIDMTADPWAWIGGLSPSGPQTVQQQATLAHGDTRYLPAVVTAADALRFVVTVDSNPASPTSGSTVGSGTVHLLVLPA